MRQRTIIALITFATALTGLALVNVLAQSKPAPVLTAMDYVQIRQLVSRYAYALDTGGNNGYDFADLFLPDGEFIDPNAKGREQIAALARSSVQGPLNTIHYGMTLVLEPSRDGAIGRQYVTEFNFDDNVPPLGKRTQWEVVGDKRGDLRKDGGQYKDVYVKTAKGWRFKSRQVVRSKSGGGTDPELMAFLKRPVRIKSEASDNVTAPKGSLSVWDYQQIEQLVASYGHALDSGFGKGDNGDAYAGLYTRDGLAFLNTKGYEALAALAREQPRGPNYVRHYITHHLIDPSPEGATGKAYLAVLDIGEHGKPNTVFLGGHYEDTYVRTPEGWRIKTRNLLPPKHGPQPAQASAR
jgi:actinorhodin biosynthesis protein ActVIA